LKYKTFVTFAAALLALGAAVIPAMPQSNADTGITVEANPQLFAVMCALVASGFDANAVDPPEFPERAALRQKLQQQQGPATDALRKFYKEHALIDPGEMMSRFVSFSLVVGPPPHFVYQLDRELLPPDVLTLEGFDQILTGFYREAQIDREWQHISKEYDQEVQRYEGPVQKTLFIVTGYLRELMQGTHGRTFNVYVEPLTGSRINFRNYGDHYAIVVGSQSQIPIDDIRHAYLHFVIDPMVMGSRLEIDKKRDLGDIAAQAPLLPVEYREEFYALFDECAVRAVELRIKKMSPTEQEAELTQDDLEGLILVRPIFKELKLFEKEGQSMHYYFPDLIKGIDVEDEKDRLKGVKFATAIPKKVGPDNTHVAATPAATAAPATDADLEKELSDGDRQIARQNGPAAQAAFEKVLASHPGEPRATFGLALAMVLQGKATQAEQLFQQIVAGAAGNAGVDPETLAWSHVYLGRIHDLQGDREQALTEYDAALMVKGAPDAVRSAAQRGQSSPYSPGGTKQQ
jgi:hypothetical protein